MPMHSLSAAHTNRVHHRPHTQLDRPTRPNRLLDHHRFDQLPLSIRHITFVATLSVTHFALLLLARMGCLLTPIFIHQEPPSSLFFIAFLAYLAPSGLARVSLGHCY